MELAWYGSFFALVFVVFYNLFAPRRTSLLPGSGYQEPTGPRENLLDSLAPLTAKLSILNRIVLRNKAASFASRYKPLFLQAGIQRVQPENMLVYKEICAVIMLFLAWSCRFIMVKYKVSGALDSFALSLLIYTAAGAFGFFYPDNFLKRVIASRKKRIVRSMPYILDLLVLGVEAGIPLVNTIQNIVARSQPGDLIDEFSIYLREIDLGADQIEALQNLSSRLNITQINNFVREISHAIKYGKSLGKPLRDLSETMRTERFMMAEKAAAQAAVKLTFPLVLFIFPVVLIVVGGPAFIMLTKSL